MPPLPRDDLLHVLDHTRELWNDLRGQRIFVTGATGFFGCWLLETFAFANDELNLGANLVGLTRDPEAFRRRAPHLADHPAISLRSGDVRDFTFPAGGFSYVIHAAVDYCEPLEHFTSNVKGTSRTLDFAAKAGVKRYLLTSSGAVYGRQPAGLAHVSESHDCAPDTMNIRSAYGEAKRASEFLCTAFSDKYDFATLIARCFAFVGPYLPLYLGSAIGNFIGDAIRGGPICIKGNGTPYRSYLYGSDLAVWLWTILFRGASCHPYNVGSDIAYSITEVARIVSEIADPKVEIRTAGKAVPGSTPERYIPSIERVRSELGLEPRIGLHESVRRMVEWHRKQRNEGI